MKYVDAALNILYIVIMLIVAIVLFVKSKTKKTNIMAATILLFSLFDGAYLFKIVFENVSDYYLSSWSTYLETASLIGMSISFILMYHVIYADKYEVNKNNNTMIFMYLFLALEIAVCFFPLSNYFGKDYGGSTVIISLIKDVPLFLHVLFLFFIYINHRKEGKFKWVPLLLLITIACQIGYHLNASIPSFSNFLYGRNYSLVLIAFIYLASKNYDYSIIRFNRIHLPYIEAF